MQPDNATGQITLDAVFRAAWRMRWLMLACVVVCTGLAAAAAWIMTPKYRVSAVMIPVKGDDSRSALSSVVGQLGGLASLAGVALSGGGNKDEYLEYLRSHEFTARFIEDEKLLPVLFAKKWDATHGRWNVVDPDDVPTLNDGVDFFDRGIRSDPGGSPQRARHADDPVEGPRAGGSLGQHAGRARQSRPEAARDRRGRRQHRLPQPRARQDQRGRTA